MRKKVGIVKRMSCLLLIFLLSINSFAAIVSDNDGSAFITKAEFDALKSSFQAQIDTYNQSIDSKIDGAIASYLSGIKLSRVNTHRSIFDSMGIMNDGYKALEVIGKNNKKWLHVSWATGTPFGDFDVVPSVINYFSNIITYGSGFTETTQPGAKGGHVSFQGVLLRQGGNNANVTAEGSGNDVDAIKYGQRCFCVSYFTERCVTNASNWVGLIPIWYDPANTILPDPTITFNFPKPIRTGWQSSGNSFLSHNLMTKGAMLVLRNGAESATYPAYTPPRALRKNDGTYSTTGWSYVDPQLGSDIASYLASGSTGYSGYMVSSASGDTLGDNVLQFWPGGGSQKLFLMDMLDIGLNFKEYTLPTKPDGSKYKWGEWSEIGLTSNYDSFKFVFDEDLRDLAKARGYATFPYHSTGTPPDDFNMFLSGKLYEYDAENRRKELSTLRWSQASSALGKDVILGETPLILHNVEKDGKMTIDGSGIKLTYWRPSSDYKDNSKVYLAFTKTGAVNEVDKGTTGAPNWDVNNTIPFEYKEAGTNTWIAAPGNKLYQTPGTGAKWVNIRFDVEKGDDIYLHAVCSDYRDDQNLYVYVKPDTVCTLEAED